MNAIIVIGNTYPHRRALAALGAKWSRDREAWVCPESARAALEELAAAHGLRFYDEDEAEEAELAPPTEAERRERQRAKMEAKADRLRGKAERQSSEADRLVAGIPRHETDYAWLTQPVVPGSSIKRFNARREKIAGAMAEAGEAAGKAAALEHALERQETPAFCQRRMDEAAAALRKIAREKAGHGMQDRQPATGEWLARLEAEELREADKLEYWRAQLEAVGGIQHSKANVHKGDLVLIKGCWCEVDACGPKNVIVLTYGLRIPYLWAEVKEHKPAGSGLGKDGPS